MKNNEMRLNQASVEDLLAELAKRGAAGSPTNMTAIEQRVEETHRKLGEQTIDVFLTRASAEESSGNKPCPQCGQRVGVNARGRPRTIRTVTSQHKFRRNYHYCTRCRKGFCPLDSALGLPADGEVTREMERRILDVGLTEVFEDAAERWTLHYGGAISENLVRRVVERIGSMAAKTSAVERQKHLAVPEATATEDLMVQADGCMLPMRGSEPWKEAKLGVVVRQEHHCVGTKTQRGSISKARYVAHVGGVDAFRTELSAALDAEQVANVKRLVWIGDGAPWIWNLAASLSPSTLQRIEVLDWGHAIEKATHCARTLFGEASPWVSLWTTSVQDRLRAGRVEEVIADIEACVLETRVRKQRVALRKLQRYYQRNAERMRYRLFRDSGIAIGSGTIESGHRHVLQKRMKCAGQHWDLKRAQRMAMLRAAYRTAGPAHVYQALCYDNAA